MWKSAFSEHTVTEIFKSEKVCLLYFTSNFQGGCDKTPALLPAVALIF